MPRLLLRASLGYGNINDSTKYGTGKKFGDGWPFSAYVTDATTILYYDVADFDASVPQYQILLNFIDSIPDGD